jgi:hypothetical protein
MQGKYGGTKKICLIRDICGCFYSEKKNFHKTRQLVTLSIVKTYVSELYDGDLFRFTHHPLITFKWHIMLIYNKLHSQFTRHPKKGDEWVTSELTL